MWRVRLARTPRAGVFNRTVTLLAATLITATAIEAQPLDDQSTGDRLDRQPRLSPAAELSRRALRLSDGRRVVLRRDELKKPITAGEPEAPAAIDRPLPMLPRKATVPAFFEENVGQFDEQAYFVSRGTTYALFATANGFVSVVGRAPNEPVGDELSEPYDAQAIGVIALNAEDVKPRGVGKLRAAANRYVGKEPSGWRKSIPLYSAVHYRGLYPGIDMVISGGSGRLSYGFVLGKDADPESIRLQFDGKVALSIDRRGNLLIKTPSGTLVQTAPSFFEEKGKAVRRLAGQFTLQRTNIVGFKVQRRTPGASMIIDPLVVFSSYFGGSGQEGMLGADSGALDLIGRGFDIDVNSAGEIFVTGMTFSPDFPTTTGPVLNGSSDAFAMRVDPTNVTEPLGYVTFLGGSQEDRGRAIAATPAGEAFITGFTFSADFPSGSGGGMFEPTHSGGFITRLDADGTLDRTTMISPIAGYHPNSIELDVAEQDLQTLYVGGWVTASEAAGQGALATPEALQASVTGTDGFVAGIDPDLTAYQALTFLGGAQRDVVMDVAVRDGQVYASGVTNSFDFPSTDFAEQPQHSSADEADSDCPTPNARTCFDSFAVRLDGGLTDLVYGTYLGAAATEDFARGIAVTSSHRAVVTGASRPAEEPGVSNIQVWRLDSGGILDYQVTLPGSGMDHGEEVVVDAFGRAHFTGTTSEAGPDPIGASIEIGGVLVPTAQHPQGGSDFFYGRIDDDGELNFFSYLGGSASDRGFAIATIGATEENFCAHVVGSTTSTDLDLVNENQDQPSGSSDLALVSLCDFRLPPVIFKEGPDTAAPGEAFQYFVVISNPGDEEVDVEVTDTFDSTVLVLGVIGCGLPPPGGNTFSCEHTVEGQDNEAILIQAVAPTTCGTVFENRVSMEFEFEGEMMTDTDVHTAVVDCCGNGNVDDGEECDGQPNCREDCTFAVCGDGVLEGTEECDGGPDCGDDCTLIPPPPDETRMGIEKWVEPEIVCNGEEVQWYIRVSNPGETVLEDVVAVDSTHVNFDFDEASIATCAEGDSGVTCDLLDIQAGGNRTFHLDGTVSGGPGLVCIPARASADNFQGFNVVACVDVRLCDGDPCIASSDCLPDSVCGTTTVIADDDSSSPFCTLPVINIPAHLLGMCTDPSMFHSGAACQTPGDGVMPVD